VRQLTAMISGSFGIKPVLTLETDESLLGGLWLRIGETVYDRTVRNNLRKLKDRILARYGHEVQRG
jgi:F-type H+-transporting ATPase subunit delta